VVDPVNLAIVAVWFSGLGWLVWSGALLRSRPFLSASEPRRPYSEVRAERSGDDPLERVHAEIERLEAEAAGADDLEERKRLQCEAEAWRCALAERRR
jgi:hypothetical protein